MSTTQKRWRIILDFHAVDGETAEDAHALLSSLIAGDPGSAEDACFKGYRVVSIQPAGTGEPCPECQAKSGREEHDNGQR